MRRNSERSELPPNKTAIVSATARPADNIQLDEQLRIACVQPAQERSATHREDIDADESDTRCRWRIDGSSESIPLRAPIETLSRVLLVKKACVFVAGEGPIASATFHVDVVNQSVHRNIVMLQDEGQIGIENACGKLVDEQLPVRGDG